MEEEKKKMGGRREGAGRPSKSKHGDTHVSTFRLSADVWDILLLQENRTKFVEQAIREKYRRDTY